MARNIYIHQNANGFPSLDRISKLHMLILLLRILVTGYGQSLLSRPYYPTWDVAASCRCVVGHRPP